MGILRICNDFIDTQPHIIANSINWLKRECKAQVLKQSCTSTYTYLMIEGEGIPEGEQYFEILFRGIAKGVHTIEIK